MKTTIIFTTKNIFGIFFWAPIAVNRYQIEPGYVPELTYIIWQNHAWCTKYGYSVLNGGIYNSFLSFWAHYSCHGKTSCTVNDIQNLVRLISFKSTETVPLNYLDNEKRKIKKTHYWFQIWLFIFSAYFTAIFDLNSFNNSSSFILDALTYFCNFDALAHRNWQCSFLAILNFSLCDLKIYQQY